MSSPTTTPDISGLSIHDHRASDGYDHPFYSTVPSPYSIATGAQPPLDVPFNNTLATMGNKYARTGLPSHWLDQQATNNTLDTRSISPPTDISSTGSPPPPQLVNAPNMAPSAQLPANSMEDEIIPTAIVIKNIPFSVKKETLLEIIASLSIPTPYAFNYHLDTSGAFRGLAFANFRLAADADAVVAALNGFEVQGRKLRVEYKKVLQAGEKERIEREKALRRMRSMQLEKEKERLAVSVNANSDFEDYGVIQQAQSFPIVQGPIGSGIGLGYPGNDNGGSTSPRSFNSGPLNNFPYSSSVQTQLPSVVPLPSHYLPVQRPPQQIQTPQLRISTPPSGTQNSSNSLDGMLQEQYARSFSPPSHASASPPIQPSSNLQPKNSAELDLNDPSTLEIYSRILVFKEDRMRDELAFSRSLTPKQRRVVHLVAQKLGVYHYSVGEGDERYAVVTRIERENRQSSQRQGDVHTLSRAQSTYLNPSAIASPTRTASAALRVKKSMPDLASLHTPPPRLNSRSSNGNIREGYSATISSPGRRANNASFRDLFGTGGSNTTNGGTSIPPVPTLPPLPSHLVDSSSSTSSGVVRQPRGPAGNPGFGLRRTSDLVRTGNNGNTNAINASGANTSDHLSPGGLDARSHEPLEL
ncbi:uncharacterized protein EI90DRAFT_2674144 [Cantharellus anzutake]|uniref:uncharacterized protein n=1 Tax=Cantharellus anzutake TaxID=1750568 RepID=UPI001908978A|nr:uncharacterized protein EI90DRAFT_2674144 [Cantharellus anzutake]KAF8337634.1 hypothetical protein EI90DRAFT_2674144 [Cantharellus anzutake]